jgi:hypothetical protein
MFGKYENDEDTPPTGLEQTFEDLEQVTVPEGDGESSSNYPHLPWNIEERILFPNKDGEMSPPPYVECIPTHHPESKE